MAVGKIMKFSPKHLQASATIPRPKTLPICHDTSCPNEAHSQTNNGLASECALEWPPRASPVPGPAGDTDSSAGLLGTPLHLSQVCLWATWELQARKFRMQECMLS